MIIGVDFDGTCVTHSFPYVGNDIGAAPVLKKLVDAGHKLILYTMRDNRYINAKDFEGSNQMFNPLQDAVKWFEDNNIPLWGINCNPHQPAWNSSPKVYCHMYIDDAALGCPVEYNENLSDRAFVDWEAVEKALIKEGALPNDNT